MKLSARTLTALANSETPLDPDRIIDNARSLLDVPNFGKKSLAELAHWVFAQRPAPGAVVNAAQADDEIAALRAEVHALQSRIAELSKRRDGLSAREKNLALLKRLADEYPADAPEPDHIQSRQKRNADIIAQHIKGKSKASLSREYGMTPNQIANIVRTQVPSASNRPGYRYHGLSSAVFNAVRHASRRHYEDMSEPTPEEVIAAGDWSTPNLGKFGRTELANWADKRYPGLLDAPDYRAANLRSHQRRFPNAGAMTPGEIDTMMRVRRALTMRDEGRTLTETAKALGVSVDQVKNMLRHARHCDLEPR